MTVATATTAATVATVAQLVPLRAAVQNYAWGIRPASNSLVARLHALNAGAAVDDEQPYAELWMGVHPSGPALLASDLRITLASFLSNGAASTIPYLLKVLSVSKPLSIQAHPHKELAARLHQENPTAYKDDNHKPEMCVALTDFEGMCNFRPLPEVYAYLTEYALLGDLCGGPSNVDALKSASTSDDKRAALRAVFSALMTAGDAAMTSTLGATNLAVKSKPEPTDTDSLFMRLCDHYPGDVGCFSAYLLNHVRIRPGQAFFMAANEPHAYLNGQCVEIMANSDNVVRAGLTPKFKDVTNLIAMLTYNDGPPTIMEGNAVDAYATLYQPPAEEFQLTKYVVPAGKTHNLPPAKGIGLVLCLGGSGWIRLTDGPSHRLPLALGSVYYVPDGARITVQSDESAVHGAPSPDLFFFRAGANEKV